MRPHSGVVRWAASPNCRTNAVQPPTQLGTKLSRFLHRVLTEYSRVLKSARNGPTEKRSPACRRRAGKATRRHGTQHACGFGALRTHSVQAVVQLRTPYAWLSLRHASCSPRGRWCWRENAPGSYSDGDDDAENDSPAAAVPTRATWHAACNTPRTTRHVRHANAQSMRRVRRTWRVAGMLSTAAGKW